METRFAIDRLLLPIGTYYTYNTEVAVEVHFVIHMYLQSIDCSTDCFCPHVLSAKL